MSQIARCGMIAAIVFVIAVAPIVYFRMVYDHDKRLRAVEEGRLYRSGQMTAEGFEEAVRRLGIKTVINVQDDFPDPDVQEGFWSAKTIKESALCARLGVRYVFIGPDLISRKRVPDERPEAIDQFLALMDRRELYPVLLHCKAGLHRTGCLAGVYRMEYQGWTRGEAYRELKAHGFGDSVCTAANDYVKQYILTYQAGQRLPAGVAQGQK